MNKNLVKNAKEKQRFGDLTVRGEQHKIGSSWPLVADSCGHGNEPEKS
jgi:hypothetical protein